MCAPAIGLIGAAVSAVGSVVGAGMAAQGQRQQAEAQARNMEYNAVVEGINRRSRWRESLVEQERLGDKFGGLLGQQTAALGAGGIDPYSGSALDVFHDTFTDRNIEQGLAYTEKASQAAQHENKKNQLLWNAQNTRQAGEMQAQATMVGGIFGGASSLLGGFGKSLGSGS